MSAGDLVFLTGATGFVGAHVCDALLDRGYRVRALVRQDGHALEQREGCTTVRGDVRRSGELVTALRGCRYVIHTAAMYSFAPRDRALMHEVNVSGTIGLLEAARIAGVERAVVTSSSAAVGPAHRGAPATESDWGESHHATSAYHTSKILQERAALAARIPVVTVLPTAPIGAGDHRPTPTGRMVLDVMRGRIWATLAGGMNVVDVEDVAVAHVSALEHGRARERYLAGGENLSLSELWAQIAGAAGRPAPRVRLPYALAAGIGVADELRCRISGSDPAVPLEGVRMGRLRMHVSSEKAARELGHHPRPVRPAIDRAVAWYREHAKAA